MKAKLINDMYLQKRQYESSIQEEQSKSEKLSARVSHFSSVLHQYNALIRQQKQYLNSLKKDVLEQKKLSKQIVLHFGAQVTKCTEMLKNKVVFIKY